MNRKRPTRLAGSARATRHVQHGSGGSTFRSDQFDLFFGEGSNLRGWSRTRCTCV